MTTTATTPAVTNGNKVISSTSARAQAIIAKANAKQATAPLLTAKEVRQEIVKQNEYNDAKAKEQAKEVKAKPASKPVKAAKPAKKAKEVKVPMMTCSEAMGIVMKSNPKATAEVIINKADTLYISKSGKESNIFQMGKYYHFATTFLKGYNSK